MGYAAVVLARFFFPMDSRPSSARNCVCCDEIFDNLRAWKVTRPHDSETEQREREREREAQRPYRDNGLRQTLFELILKASTQSVSSLSRRAWLLGGLPSKRRSGLLVGSSHVDRLPSFVSTTRSEHLFRKHIASLRGYVNDATLHVVVSHDGN